MDPEQWTTAMDELTAQAQFLLTCDALDLGGLEVQVVSSPDDRAHASTVTQVDLVSDGLLYVFSEPSLLAFHARATDMDLGWYDEDGHQISQMFVPAGTATEYLCEQPFHYALQVAPGNLPQGGVRD